MIKVILVDAWNTFVTSEGVFEEMKTLLDSFSNKKIILTNANDEQMVKLGIVDMPYEVFTLAHNPDKVDPVYYQKMFETLSLKAEDVIYFEHNEDAVKSAKSQGINVYHYDKEKKDLASLKEFLETFLN